MPQRADIIRVSGTENGLFLPGRGSEFRDLSGESTWEYEEKGRELCVLTDLLTVRIDRESGSVSYELKDGKVLLREAFREPWNFGDSICLEPL